ncbi:DnaB-like helicase C-terminal domain-containing protein [Planctomycetota bacterium]
MCDEKGPSRREFLAAGAAATVGVVCGTGLTNATPRKTEPDTPIEIPTGFKTLDGLTGGLHRSELAILTSPPSIGKTALALNIADHVAVEARIPTFYVTLQASQIEIAQRLLCARGNISQRAMRDRSLSDDDRRRLTRAGAELSGSPFYIDDKPARTVAAIQGLATRLNERLRHQSRLGLLVVDHLQLVHADSRTQSRNEQLEELVQDLKNIAKRMNVAVLCLWQLNRQPTSVGNQRPSQGNLRAVERAADIVLLLHRDDHGLSSRVSEQRGIDGDAQLAVVRPTDLAANEIGLSWQSDYTRFVDVATG